MAERDEAMRCPFCGGRGFVKVDMSRVRVGGFPYRPGCDDFRCRGWYGTAQHYRTKAEAIEAWNRRAS